MSNDDLLKIREQLIEYSNHLQHMKLNSQGVERRHLNDKQQKVDKYIICLAEYLCLK